MQQRANKNRKEESCRLVNMAENNADFQTLLSMVSEEGNVLSTFIREEGFSLCVSGE